MDTEFFTMHLQLRILANCKSLGSSELERISVQKLYTNLETSANWEEKNIQNQ